MWNYVLVLCFIHSCTGAPQKTYRNDYDYNPKTDAFYKLHTEGASFEAARKRCNLEGGYLMVPGPGDLEHAHLMYKRYPELDDWAFVGEDAKDHEPIDPALGPDACNFPASSRWLCPYRGTTPSSASSSCEVMSRGGDVRNGNCYTQRPFFCKVYANYVTYDQQCQVYTKGYVYKAATGSCYKVPLEGMSWNSGEGFCEGDSGHLAVINSEQEDQVLLDLLQSMPSFRGDLPAIFYYIGFRRREASTDSDFRTIFNQTLEQAGFASWADNEPNNGGTRREFCGTMLRTDGKLNDLHCNGRYGVICEKEVAARS